MERIKELALGDDEKFVRSETLFANAAPILIHRAWCPQHMQAPVH
jgi:hypothetical protein